ncbi:hypothetical protein LXL04_019265 [Taraxacum kok-saghyz]
MPSLSTVALSFKTFTDVDLFLQRRSKSLALHLPLGTSMVDLTRTAKTRNSDGGARSLPDHFFTSSESVKIRLRVHGWEKLKDSTNNLEQVTDALARAALES